MQQEGAIKRFKRVFIQWFDKQKEAGMTRPEFCDLLGVKSATIDKWINLSDNRAPTCENLLKVANAMGCTVDYLIREGAPESREPDITNAAACTGLSENAVKRLRQLKEIFPSEAAVIDTLLSMEFELSTSGDLSSGSGINHPGVLTAITDYLDKAVEMRSKLLKGGFIDADNIEYEQFKLTRTVSDIIGHDAGTGLNGPLLLEYMKIRYNTEPEETPKKRKNKL